MGAQDGDGSSSLPPARDRQRGRRHVEQVTGAKRFAHSGAIVVKVVAAALSLFTVVYLGYLWNTVRGLNNNVQRVQLFEGGRSIDKKTGKVITRYDIDGKAENILIVGNDDRSALTLTQARELRVGKDGGSLNTDTMMIVHVPADGTAATLISLPRDTYVNIPGYGMNKLNAAYPDGYINASGSHRAKIAAGANLVIQVIENLTGLNIDHFVQVSLLGFVNISDAVGGVTVNMCHAVNDTVPHDRAIGLSGGSGLVIGKGEHTIHGVQALEFVRQREQLTGGDVARTARQRYFLTAAFRKVASAGVLFNVGKLEHLVNAVDKSLYVDQNLNMLDLAKQMSNLSANNISGEAIPTDHYENVIINGYTSNVGIVIPSQVKAFVHKMITSSATSTYQQAKTVAPNTVTVDVRNFGAHNGAAAAAATTLSKAGFKTTVDQTPGSRATTAIEYPAGSEAQAKTLAQYVPGATVAQANVSSVTLTLGADGITARSTAEKHHSHKRKPIDAGCIN
jgi:LCP family protein required for cell wall assembly